ncbi:retrovirus-related Pol polyprotein from transposon 17.6 [Trichonephila clavipes]|nr:retrovirus-related Pol polyprotein from transposon 17.6 [Trichonephila clavipes]
MAPRTIDAAVVQKDSLGVDELLSKLEIKAPLQSPGKILLLPFPIREEVPPWTEKPDVNSLWIAEQTSRSSLGQKRKLLIDLHNRKLIDGVTNLSIKGEVATIQENNDLSTVNRASKYFNLLNSYPDLTKPNLVNRVVKHGIPIAEEDKEKTAITTPFGLYEFNTMSFGQRNAPSTFQRFITEGSTVWT